MSHGWHDRLTSAVTEGQVAEIAREFVAQFSPPEIVALPERCRPGKIRDSQDVTEIAYALVRHRCETQGTPYLAHKLTDFFANATVRLSQILQARIERGEAAD